MIFRQPLLRHQTSIDRLVNVIAVVGPLTSVPQIAEIWFIDKSAVGVSLVTWSLFLLMACIWLLYGIVHKARPIIISNSLWILAQAIIVLGALYYDGDLF
jgi:MtN3 and saliva related transmembrane protein